MGVLKVRGGGVGGPLLLPGGGRGGWRGPAGGRGLGGQVECAAAGPFPGLEGRQHRWRCYKEGNTDEK